MSDNDQTACSQPPDGRTVTRRGFLEWMIGLMGGLTVVSIAGSALSFLKPPGHGGGGNEPAAVADVSQIPLGDGIVVPFDDKPAIIINTEKGLVAFSAVCPHAQCSVIWDKDKKRIFCPCHAGVFDLEGNVVSGPPPSPLPRYQVKIEGEKILLSKS
ncbi:MAG: QcrA and Rieske domain-containing protein [Armatimonadota bacterium]